MSEFHVILRAVHGEMWEAGPDQGPALQALLDDLSGSGLPEGVSRLPNARMALGPHLAPQITGDLDNAKLAWLDTRRGTTGPGRRRAAP